MNTRKKASAARPTERSVYEIRPTQGRAVTVEAASAADLAEQLARLAGLDPYGSRAAAHVLHVLRGRIDALTFAARRLGVMTFQPDQQPLAASSSVPPAGTADTEPH